MISEENRTTPERRWLETFRITALVSVALGAIESVTLMLRVGRRNSSFLLLLLFTGWVLSPFLALAWTGLLSKSWPALTRATLYILMFIVTFASLAIYGRIAFGPPRAKSAPAFLLTPLASWLLLAIVVPVAALISRRRSRPDGLSTSPTRHPH